MKCEAVLRGKSRVSRSDHLIFECQSLGGIAPLRVFGRAAAAGPLRPGIKSPALLKVAAAKPYSFWGHYPAPFTGTAIENMPEPSSAPAKTRTPTKVSPVGASMTSARLLSNGGVLHARAPCCVPIHQRQTQVQRGHDLDRFAEHRGLSFRSASLSCKWHSPELWMRQACYGSCARTRRRPDAARLGKSHSPSLRSGSTPHARHTDARDMSVGRLATPSSAMRPVNKGYVFSL